MRDVVRPTNKSEDSAKFVGGVVKKVIFEFLFTFQNVMVYTSTGMFLTQQSIRSSRPIDLDPFSQPRPEIASAVQSDPISNDRDSSRQDDSIERGRALK